MADTHESIHEEVEITLKVKVTLTQASFYGTRTGDQLRHEIESAKKDLHLELMNKLTGSWRSNDLGENKWGYVNYLYDVEPDNDRKSATEIKVGTYKYSKKNGTLHGITGTRDWNEKILEANLDNVKLEVILREENK